MCFKISVERRRGGEELTFDYFLDGRDDSARQEERLVMIRLAMEQKLGVDATNKHYDISGRVNGTVAANGASAPLPVSAGVGEDAQEQMPSAEDDGMYL